MEADILGNFVLMVLLMVPTYIMFHDYPAGSGFYIRKSNKNCVSQLPTKISFVPVSSLRELQPRHSRR